MSVYTKTGDQGSTGLFTGERIAKNSLRVEAYGTVDEMNSALALARAFCRNETVVKEVLRIQKINGLLMAQLASLSGDPYITATHIKETEAIIDRLEGCLPPLASFIVPGETPGGAALDLARTTIRRAERRVLDLANQESIQQNLIILLNRLSDLCFVLMRLEES